MPISAEVHSDDRLFEVEFDAEPWFDQAGDGRIISLADCEWGGDLPADEVASFFEEIIPEIETLMDHCRARMSPVGFECHVNEKDALRWVWAHRPHLEPTLTAMGFFRE